MSDKLKEVINKLKKTEEPITEHKETPKEETKPKEEPLPKEELPKKEITEEEKQQLAVTQLIAELQNNGVFRLNLLQEISALNKNLAELNESFKTLLK